MKHLDFYFSLEPQHARGAIPPSGCHLESSRAALPRRRLTSLPEDSEALRLLRRCLHSLGSRRWPLGGEPTDRKERQQRLGRTAEAAAGADAIVHLGALGSVPRSVSDPIASHAANATGTLMVLEAARREGAYVTAASSSSVYGSVPDLPRTEEQPTRPMSPYAASKLATEGYVLAFGSSYGMATLPFRFFNVYGPRQSAGHVYAAVIPVFIDAALRGDPLPLNGDGLQSRDFTFVDTVTWVLADAVHRKVTSDRPVNLAIGANMTLLDLIAELERLLGRELPIERRPSRVGDVRASQSKPDLLRKLFPEVPVVPFEQGLAATLEWFRSQPGYAG